MSQSTSNYIWVNDELNNIDQITPRRYTIIHDSNSSDLFLCINHDFMYKNLIPNKFKTLCEWITYDEKKYLYYMYIDVDYSRQTKNFNPVDTVIEELPILIKASKYGETSFFIHHEHLLNSSIYVFIHSINSEHDCIYYIGKFSDYS